MSMNDNNENSQNQKPDYNLSEQQNSNMQDSNFNMQPKKSPLGDIFLGLGLSLALIASMIVSLYSGSAGLFSIIMFILMTCATFLSVKLIKQNHPIAGKILLATIIPLTLLLLLFGACFVSLGVL